MASVTKQMPATWREADGDSVAFPDAVSQWALAARDVLMTTAREYNGLITQAELADAVQQASGVRTKAMVRNWIGAVLEATADECKQQGGPSLTSLCVDRDGSVGPGYAHVLSLNGIAASKDLEHQAATDRLACYMAYATDIPAHGGYAELSPQIAAVRRREARLNPAPKATCPSCFTVLPSSGQCDNCG